MVKKDEEIVKKVKSKISVKDNIEKLSQEIFGKPSKDIKYLLVTNFIHQQLLEEELARTGLYQWLNVFNGEVKQPRDVINYKDYDIVQVNLSTQDIHLANDIREELGEKSDTKLVLNNDYTTEMWGVSFPNPSTIYREVQGADMLVGTEFYQVTALTEISGRKCYILPHPGDIKRLKSLAPIPKKEIITTLWRRYDRFVYIPHLVVRNHGLTTQLIGYDKKFDKKTWLTTTLYDYVFAGTNYFEFCNQMRESRLVYDPFTFHSFSRATIDTAALKVPVVGTNRTQSMNVCYPHTIVDPYDVTTARKLITKILEDKEFHDKVVNTAYERVEFYNHENSRERYLAALSDALKVGRKPVKAIKKVEKPTRGRGDDVNILQSKELNRDETKEKN